jgi:hypothetical protein
MIAKHPSTQHDEKQRQATREASKKPGAHDVHEQREHDQKQEGAVAPALPTSKEASPRRSGAV